MDGPADDLTIEPSSKKPKLDYQTFGTAETHLEDPWFQDIPSGSFQASSATTNPAVPRLSLNERFQVLDEFVSDDDLEQVGDMKHSFGQEDDEDSVGDNEEEEEDNDDSDSLLSEIDALLDEGLPEMYNKEPKRKRGAVVEADVGASKEADKPLPEGVVGVRTKTILRSEYRGACLDIVFVGFQVMK